MAEERKKHKHEGLKVPPERWIVQRPFDSAEFLEGAPPRYADPDGDGDSDGDADDTGPSAPAGTGGAA